MADHVYHTHAAQGAEPAQSFTEAFELFYPRLCLFAFKTVQDWQLAEDLVQDCFVRVWERRHEVAPTLPYLYTCVRNAVRMHYRPGRRPALSSEELPEPADDDLLRAVIETETLSEIFAAMEQLPLQCRTICSLLYVDGKSYREIARRLRISESTIRTQKAKGITLIRQRLKHFLMLMML